MDNATSEIPEFSPKEPLPHRAFDGEVSTIEIKPVVCPHDACIRVDSGTVECEKCGAGWLDHGKFVIRDGKMTLE